MQTMSLFHTVELCNFALRNTTKQPRLMYLKTLNQWVAIEYVHMALLLKLRLEGCKSVSSVGSFFVLLRFLLSSGSLLGRITHKYKKIVTKNAPNTSNWCI